MSGGAARAEREALVAAARAARARAYAPYSGYRVGAAVRAHGRVYGGCNVENASYGLTECAERVAIFKAVSAGARAIEALAVVVDGAAAARPCGACRQVMREFGPRARVYLASAGSGEVLETEVAALLPGSFGPEDLGVRPVEAGREGRRRRRDP